MKDITVTLPFSKLRNLGRLPGKITFRDVFYVSLALHLLVMAFPRDATVFDELYYTAAARDLLHGVASNLEHPFLGKAWGALGIALLGDSWFGWRLPSVIFAQLALIAFYLLARDFLGERNAVYASALLAFDTIFFIHGSLLLPDVAALFFALLAFCLYFRRSYYLSALAWAAALLSKETSIFLLFAFILFHAWKHGRAYLSERELLQPRTRKVVAFLAILLLATLVPIWIYDAAYHPGETQVVLTPTVIVDEKGMVLTTTTKTSTKTVAPITNPLEHIQFMVRYMGSLTIKPDSKPDQNNYALNWVLPLPPKELVYYSVAVTKNITKSADGKILSTQVIITNPIHWVGLGNYPLWILGFWMSVIGILYLIVRKKNSETETFALFWILGTYVPFLFISYGLHRIVYPFYFVITVPALALAVPALLGRIIEKQYRNYVKLAFILPVLLWFFWFFPVRVTAF